MVSPLQIVESFWNQPGIDDRLRLLSHLINCNDSGTDGFFLGLLADENTSIGIKAAEMLSTRNPWLRLQAGQLSPFPVSMENDEKVLVWRELERGITAYVDRHGNQYDKYVAFTHFPGLHQLLHQTLENRGLTAAARHFGENVNLEQKFNRTEILFSPTYRCNLSCPYCYSKQWHTKFGAEAEMHGIEKLIQWMKRQNLTSLSLAGGEPTVYGKLQSLLSLLSEQSMTLHIATNMLFNRKVADRLNRKLVRMVTAHYDQSYLRNRVNHERFRRNLQILRAKEIPFRIRYTLTGQSRQSEWREIFSFLERSELDTLHFALTFTNFEQNNRSVVDGVGKRDAIKTLIEFCDDALKRKIGLHLCKPVPLCLFPVEKLNQYLLAGIIKNPCVARDADCSRNIMVNPDFSTFPCTTLAHKGPRITDFETVTDAGVFFQQYIQELVKIPYLPECSDCFYFFSGFCQQVCLAEKSHYRTTSH